MAWVILVVAGLLEIGWAIGLKYSGGLTRPWPAAATVAMMVASMWLLAIAVRTLPVGTAYAVWTGIGTVGTVAVGIAVLGEPATLIRLACIALIIAGIAGLKMVS
ncbi:MAG: multidrug efflux SMR transporter [Vicinamibacteraceae bacterium]